MVFFVLNRDTKFESLYTWKDAKIVHVSADMNKKRLLITDGSVVWFGLTSILMATGYRVKNWCVVSLFFFFFFLDVCFVVGFRCTIAPPNLWCRSFWQGGVRRCSPTARQGLAKRSPWLVFRWDARSTCVCMMAEGINTANVDVWLVHCCNLISRCCCLQSWGYIYIYSSAVIVRWVFSEQFLNPWLQCITFELKNRNGCVQVSAARFCLVDFPVVVTAQD